MTDVPNTDGVSRRSVLKYGVLTTGVVSGATSLVGTVAGERGNHPGNLVSKVASRGHYAWFPFPLEPSTWGRSTNHFDMQDGTARWMAKPAQGGGIQCRVENLPTTFANAGFDVHLGRLGSISQIDITAKTSTSEGFGGTARVVGALYFDVNGNGEFFAWADGKGNTETWAGFAGDTERGLAIPADGNRFTINDDTEFPVFADLSPPPTLGEMKAGAIEGVDETTETALYLGVGSAGGEKSGAEEVVVQSMSVERA